MKLLDHLVMESVSSKLKSAHKREVIGELVGKLRIYGAVDIENEEDIINAIAEREQIGSTGIGNGIGIPHCKTDLIDKVICTVGISENGINFDALDDQPVHVFFLVLAPLAPEVNHLSLLAKIASMLRSKYFVNDLKKCRNDDELRDLIVREENR